MKTIKNLIHGLLDSSSTLSSKRFVGILGVFLMCFAIIMDVLYKKTLSQFMWDSLLLFVFSIFGMNTALSFKALNTKENVSTDIIDKQPDADVTDDAKDVLTSDKPA